MKKSAFFSFLLFIFLLFRFLPLAHAQGATTQKTETLEATVSKIIQQKEISVEGKEQEYQKLDLLISKGNLQNKHITVENGSIPIANPVTYQVGDKVIITASTTPDGKTYYYISDFIRRTPLYLLFAIFIGLALFIARERGLTALLGMGISFFVIFSFIIPNILAGVEPTVVVVLASLFIVPVTFYLTHGFNKKTTAAIIGTLITIIISLVLTTLFVLYAKLTGTASEGATYLTQIKQSSINLQDLLFAGIIIATLGVLNDITVSQASIVSQLRETSKTLSFRELYSKAMSVGKDHIASMINTLILVYAGAALPLLILFVNSPHPFTEVINYEIVAEEIVRTMIASIVLILAVPLTTLIACFLYDK